MSGVTIRGWRGTSPQVFWKGADKYGRTQRFKKGVLKCSRSENIQTKDFTPWNKKSIESATLPKAYHARRPSSRSTWGRCSARSIRIFRWARTSPRFKRWYHVHNSIHWHTGCEARIPQQRVRSSEGGGRLLPGRMPSTHQQRNGNEHERERERERNTMTTAGLHKAAEAMTLHTGQLHLAEHESGFFMMKTRSGNAVTTVLCSKTKQKLFDGVCHYIQGYHAGRRSC